MMGNADLISIRGRSEYARRLNKVDELKRQAEARFRKIEGSLQAPLNETEQILNELQTKK